MEHDHPVLLSEVRGIVLALAELIGRLENRVQELEAAAGAAKLRDDPKSQRQKEARYG